MKSIAFMKLAGSGNDFILIDNRSGSITPKEAGRLAAKICRHRLSIGADGLILIEPSKRADFKWRFFNSDGSTAAFCGNGARCAARFAFLKKIAPRYMVFETNIGLVESEVMGPGGHRVKVRMPEPRGLRLHVRVPINGKDWTGHVIDTGVPHCVYVVKDLSRTDVNVLGQKTRSHRLFQPAGTNVDFMSVDDEHRILLRTYERGVEGETLACGTGSIAAAIVASRIAHVESPVTVIPASGVPLVVSFDARNGTCTNVFLEGDARVVYEGRMGPEAWQ